MSNLIDEYVKRYQEALSDYESVEKIALDAIKSSLRDSGILAITSSRLKDSDRLREKLEMRNCEKKYSSIQDITDDIADLVGIRVALYFPNDRKKVEDIIRNVFIVEKIKTFPSEQRNNHIYTRRFEGYCATHYRVFIKAQAKRVIDDKIRVEIQVASLLMHAWSEVEHDLSYKQKKGKVSFDEYESLDEINGLVIAGEVSLQRLQRISEMRILSESMSFSNHYQLASFIYDKAEHKTDHRFLMGDVETLFSVLKTKNRLTPIKVENDLKNIDYNDDTPIAQQLIDLYADDNIKIAKMIISRNASKKISEFTVDEKSVGSFMVKWILLENTLIKYLQARGYDSSERSRRNTFQMLKSAQIFDNNELDDYLDLKRIRNNLVHGVEVPDNIYLSNCGNRIERLLSKFRA